MESLDKMKLSTMVLASVALVFGAFVMLAWKVGWTFIFIWSDSFAPMQFNTAFCLALTASGALCFAYNQRYWCMVLGFVLGLFALLSFSQYVFGYNLHLDELFHTAQVTTRTSSAGRMAPNTAICYAVMGLAICLRGFSKEADRHALTSCSSMIPVAFATVSLLGYSANFQDAYGWQNLSDMSPQTSLGFLFTGVALFLATVTFREKIKYANWIVVPLMVLSIFILGLLLRSMEIARVRSLAADREFTINLTFVAAILIATVVSIRFLKKLVDVNDNLEKTRLESEVSSQMKTSILRYLSHEIRNPLNAVLGFSEPYIEKEGLDGETRESFSCIHTAAFHIKNVVDDLLAISRFDSGKIQLESHDYTVRNWFVDIEKPLKKRAELQSIELTTSVDERVPEVLKGDSLKIAQIVINLTENALKYTPQEGKISIALSMAEGNKWFVITISDTGRGIPQEVKEHVFQPFFQVQESDVKVGLGLGLSICKRYLDMMEGKIEFTSEEGKGTTFTVSVRAFQQ